MYSAPVHLRRPQINVKGAGAVALWMIAAGSFCRQGGATKETPQISRINAILNWLPQDTETVMVAAKPGRFELNVRREAESTLAECAPGLAGVGLPSESRGEWAISYDYVVNGTCNYRFPKELGLMPYDGCKILGLKPRELARLRSLAKRRAKRNGIVQGLVVYVVEEPWNGDRWTYYFAFAGDLMFCATSKRYLAEVLSRRMQPVTQPGLPASFAEWKYFDKSDPLWVVRHWTPRMNKAGGGMNMHDEHLVGYAMSLSKDAKRFTVISISDNPNGFEIASQDWAGFLKQERGAAPLEIARVDDRTTRIVLNGAAPRGEVPMFMILAALGHGIAL